MNEKKKELDGMLFEAMKDHEVWSGYQKDVESCCMEALNIHERTSDLNEDVKELIARVAGNLFANYKAGIAQE